MHVAQEPAVDPGEVVNLFHGPAALERFADVEETCEVRTDEFCADMFVGESGILAVLAVDAVSAASGFERAHGFLEGLLEGASDAHGFADGFHLSGKGVVRGREFFESEARDLGDHIVDGRFEAGGRFAGDVIHDLV